MSDDFLERISKLSPKRLALLALELQDKLDAAGAKTDTTREPIAVIGMACRFPGGAHDPESYWQLLRDGGEAIREVPADRWDIDQYYHPDPDQPAHMSARCGGFLDAVDQFDAPFFGVAPREALTMDPQQRLLLEVAWEALENAGVAPERLAGSSTSVFVGICNSDHFQRVLGRGVEEIDAYLASGNAHSVASGRISHFLGLQGPSLSIDTACSSSLVALHVACQSLRTGESRMALAAGVNVMCSPDTTIALSQAHMLAPDGRCKTFDAAADGFSRGEGCGVLVLKLLCDALRDGDPVLAVVRGTASNQDGRSGGLTVPNGAAQEAVIRAALANAGVSPTDIDYVEAHGTGTSLGDPIEVRALGRALGPGRTSPLVIGSVKTNIGHLESAAGVAGVMKVILSLQHERVPPHLHFERPSPHIGWAEHPVVVKRDGQAWPRGQRRRLAGVSSFGFSGTNAHVIIEEAPARTERTAAAVDRPLSCLPISARTPAALGELARRYRTALSSGEDLANIAHTAGVGRSHFAERIAVIASDDAEAREALDALASGRTHASLFRGTANPGNPPEVVFLFTGQGSQYPAMSRLLYETSPVFREVIDRCDARLGADKDGLTLKTVIFSADTPIHETRWTQPALFAVELALTQLWRSWGIEPAAVIGHSLGELAAATAAGVFTLEDGLALIAERGRLMDTLPAGGTMAAIFAPITEVEAAIAKAGGHVAIAAINAADSVVVSGDATAVDELLADLAKGNVKGHRLFISLAAHSPFVDSVLGPFEEAARKIPMRAPRIPVAWNLTGGAPLPSGAPDATYWRRQTREPVRFADGITQLHRDGFRVFLEVGPHPTLLALAQRTLPEDVLLLTSLRREKDDWREMMTSLARLYVHGANVDFAGVDRPYVRRRVRLPTYPFEHRSWWIPTADLGQRRAPKRAGSSLLGERVPSAVPIFESTLTPSTFPWLAEHRLHGSVVVAGPVFAEMAQAAARAAFGPLNRAIDGLVIREPLTLPEDGRAVQTSLADADSSGGVRFSIHSRGDDGEWRLHASGSLTTPRAESTSELSVATLAAKLGAATTGAAYYDRLRALGIDLGPSFRSIETARRKDHEVLATIALPAGAKNDVVTWAHPVLLDGALQAVGLAVPESNDSTDVYLLTEVGAVTLSAPLPTRILCHARLRAPLTPRPSGGLPPEWRADVTLAREDGTVLGALRDVCLRRASRDALARAAGVNRPDALFYRVDWTPAPPATPAADVLADLSTVVPKARERFASLAREHGLAIYDELLPELDRLSLDHVGVALRELGFDATVGRSFTAGAEATRLGVVAKHGRLFARMLEMLANSGVLRGSATTSFEVVRAFAATDPSARYDAVLAHFGEVDGELEMLRRCGAGLARVLRGQQEPLDLLFPGGSFAEARRLYVESPYARTYNAALCETLKAALALLPAGARLRILEVGAGTGGTTTYVLPSLPANNVEYTFTDLSPLFLERAREQFGSKYPFLKRALLDIEQDPIAQGFEAGAYDVVIAANVLHATADLRQTMRHVKKLLASGGLLLLLEGVAPEPWVDLTFGLTEGWWRFSDASLRGTYPLIDRSAWLRVLGELGFTGAAAIPDGAPSSGRAAGQQALFVARAETRRRRWALIVSRIDDAVGRALATRLEDRGDAVVLVLADAPSPTLNDVDEIVYLAGLTTEDARGRALSCEVALAWLGRAARGEVDGRVWLATRGAQPADGTVSASGIWQAPLWGLGRVFALEQPARWGGLIDLPEAEPDALARMLLESLAADDGEDQTAWRSGKRFAARLAAASAPAAASIRFEPDATYLVTGGFGGLGLIVARWMAERGARHIALLGRHPDPTSDGVRAIEAAGAKVIPLAGDAADEEAMTSLFDRLAREAPPLRGIMHAAADLSAASIGELGSEAMTRMLRPKIDATVLLEKLAPDLDFLVLFSSTTALLGASGLAHYAAANAFLDAFAQQHVRARTHVLSINWGTWEAMRLASKDAQRGFKDAGLEPMHVAQATEALGRLLGTSEARPAQAVVARIDWSTLKPLHEARRRRPLLSQMASTESIRTNTYAASGPTIAEQLAAAPEEQRHDLLVGFIRREVATVLRADSIEAVPLEIGFFDQGMDSLMSVELKRGLERGTDLTLPSTLTFNYPTVTALATFLAARLKMGAGDPVVQSTVPASSLLQTATTIADLDALSDAELEAELLAEMERHR